MEDPRETSISRPLPENREPVPPPIRPAPLPQAPAPAQRTRRSFFWPIALIGFGVVLLLSNMELIPATGWAVLWRFWPVALIALGFDVLIGGRSVAGAIASTVIFLLLIGLAIGALVFAEQIPALVELARPAQLQSQYVEQPLGDVETARITIDWTSAPGTLSALNDSANLIEADVDYRGELIFDVRISGTHATVNLDSYLQGLSYGTLNFNDRDADWDVKLSPEAILDLQMDSGSGSGDYDLSELKLSGLVLDAGSGSIELRLPEASSFDGTIDGGSGSIRLIVPDDVGLRIERNDGSGSFDPGRRLELVSGDIDDDNIWETEGYDNAEVQIELYIDQGSGSLRIED